jgi:copper(I)-binding protein
MRLPSLVASLAAITLIAGCSGGQKNEAGAGSAAESVRILEPRLVLPLVKDNPGAVYFNLVNESDSPQKIEAVEVVGTEMSMIHDTVDSGGHSSMQMVHDVTIPARGSMPFVPGGRHVMVTGIKPEMKPGTNATLKISFDGGKATTIDIPVLPPIASAGN